MTVHVPWLQFARYTDDTMLHCSTLRDVQLLQEVLESVLRNQA